MEDLLLRVLFDPEERPLLKAVLRALMNRDYEQALLTIELWQMEEELKMTDEELEEAFGE